MPVGDEKEKELIEDLIKYMNKQTAKHEKETTSKPNFPKCLYTYGDTVEFKFDNDKYQDLIGEIVVVDKAGTIEQSEEPSYDIEVIYLNHTWFKHVRQSHIIRKIEQ